MTDLDIICANCKKSESMNIGNFQLFTNCVLECRHRFCKACKDNMKSGFKCPICNSLVRSENVKINIYRDINFISRFYIYLFSFCYIHLKKKQQMII